MDDVFAHAAVLTVDDEPSLIVTAREQSPLDRFTQQHVFRSEHVLQIVAPILAVRLAVGGEPVTDEPRGKVIDRYRGDDQEVPIPGQDVDGRCRPYVPEERMGHAGIPGKAIGAVVMADVPALLTRRDAIDGVLVGGHGDDVAELRVRHFAVIAFDIVVDDHLPAGFHGPAAKIIGFREGEIVPEGKFLADVGLEIGRLAGKGNRFVIEVDEDKVAQDLDADGLEGELGLVEALHTITVAGGAELAVETIGPCVVGTGDGGLDRAGALHETMRPVLTDVVVGSELARAITHHEDVLIENAAGKVVAGTGHFAGMAEVHPRTVEDLFAFQFKDCRIRVVARGQRVGAARVGPEWAGKLDLKNLGHDVRPPVSAPRNHST